MSGPFIKEICGKPVPVPVTAQDQMGFVYDHATEAMVWTREPSQRKALAADVGPITAQTTLQDVTGLGLTIGASATEIWRATWWLLVDAANPTMDLKLGFTAPASCTLKWGILGLSSEVNAWGGRSTGSTQLGLLGAANSLNTNTLAGVSGVELVAIVMGGGTAGTVQVQYAQSTSDPGNLKIDKGSAMEAVRLAA